jgi:hypothetical protein
MEKQPDYSVESNVEPIVENPDYHVDETNKMEARRGSQLNEATDMYGDVQQAEEYGYVSRG